MWFAIATYGMLWMFLFSEFSWFSFICYRTREISINIHIDTYLCISVCTYKCRHLLYQIVYTETQMPLTRLYSVMWLSKIYIQQLFQIKQPTQILTSTYCQFIGVFTFIKRCRFLHRLSFHCAFKSTG